MSAQQPGLEQLLGSWRFEPATIALLVAAGAIYVLGARAARGGWPISRCLGFLAGLLVLATALLSGIDDYSERLLSVHMLQHLLLMLLAPALLLWGAPVRLALVVSRRRGRRLIASLLHARASRALVHPVTGFATLVGVTLLTHLTGLYEAALRDGIVHALEHTAYLGAGILFLAPLIAADPLPRPPDGLVRFAIVLAGMVGMGAAGAILTFQRTVRYPFYLAGARQLHTSALADQQLAGVVMWIGGGLMMLGLAAVVVTRALLAEERRQRRRDLHDLDPLEPAGVGEGRALQGTAPR